MADFPQPVLRAGPVVPTPTPVTPAGGPSEKKRRPDPHAAHRVRMNSQAFPEPSIPGGPTGIAGSHRVKNYKGAIHTCAPTREGPQSVAAGAPAGYRHSGATVGAPRHGWGRAGLHQLRCGGGGRRPPTPCPRHRGTQAVQAGRRSSAGVHDGGIYHGTRGDWAGIPAATSPPPGRTALPAHGNPHADNTPYS